MFSNSKNQTQWPKVVSNDLSLHINKLKNKTQIISGKVQGKTKLPIPAGADRISEQDLRMAEK